MSVPAPGGVPETSALLAPQTVPDASGLLAERMSWETRSAPVVGRLSAWSGSRLEGPTTMTLSQVSGRRSRLAVVVLVVLTSGAVAGCLTMRHGSRQVVSVESNPPGAIVHIDPGGRTGTTPGQLLLARRYSQSLTFEKDGYQAVTIFLERKASSGLWRNAV